MARRRRQSAEEPGEINMTPMIDVVFQMIIFFVCTIEMEKQQLNQAIMLAHAPNGPAVERKIPGTVTVDISDKGQIEIARTPMSLQTFKNVMRKTVSMFGHTIPVVIRADGETRHEDVREVMDACKGVGLWKVKFAAVKEKNTK